jgi:hypothetical protein
MMNCGSKQRYLRMNLVVAATDNKVKIWNIAPIRDKDEDLNAQCPKLLALLSKFANHHRCANVEKPRLTQISTRKPSTA